MDLWRNAGRSFGPMEQKAAENRSDGESRTEDNTRITQTRRLERPPGAVIGVNLPELANRVREFENRRFYLLVGEINSFLRNGGIAVFSTVGETLPVATVLLGSAAGLLAAGEEPVIVLDAEYPYHGACTLLQMEDLPGLQELLSSKAGPGDVIFTARDPVVAFLGPGQGSPSPLDLVGVKMQEALRMLSDVFGRLLILAPPLGQGTVEALASAARSVGVACGLVAVHQTDTPEHQVRSALESLPEHLGTIGRVVV